jgi:hypothetical protein
VSSFFSACSVCLVRAPDSLLGCRDPAGFCPDPAGKSAFLIIQNPSVFTAFCRILPANLPARSIMQNHSDPVTHPQSAHKPVTLAPTPSTSISYQRFMSAD